MILAQARDGGDSVHERHVQIDHHRIRKQGVRKLDRRQPVVGGADDGQRRLLLDQRAKRLEKGRIVVDEQDTGGCCRRPLRLVHQGRDVSLAAVSVQQEPREVAVIGAPLDLGAGRRGVDMGPSAIRYAGLEQELVEKLGARVHDLGNIAAPVAESMTVGDDRARFLSQILDLCEEVARLVRASRQAGRLPLVLGGDHSVAIGSLVGMASIDGPGGVIWVDAHGDLNTPETSPTGNVHGMVLSAALGLNGPGFVRDGWTLPAVEAGRIALVGVRSLDDGERKLLGELEAKVFTMSEVDRRGIEVCMREALAHAAGAAFLHVSFDMDVVDPDSAPGVGTPVRGGLSYREAHLAMEIVAESGLADSLDVVEVNPILDRENATGQLAVELVLSALGARIL
jgi:arginase